jgi:phasin family protein
MTTAKKTAASTVKDSFEETVKAGQESYAKGFDQTVAFAQEQFEKAAATFFKGFDDVQGYGRANLDAVIQANTVAAKGFEEISRAWFAFAQGTVEQSVSATKALMSAKSLREVVDLQNDYAKATFDSFLAEGARLSEMGVKVTNEAIAPLSARVNATVEKFAKPVAA